MILVICGAGASYDSVTHLPVSEFPRLDSPYRPPLARELFIPDNSVAKEAVKRFPQCHDILPYLQRIPKAQTVETKLEELQTEAENDGVRKQQIAAICYYLQFLISQFEISWEHVHLGVTNYGALIDQLRRARGNQPVCIVTFNYDCMIEAALVGSIGIKIDSLSSYIADPAFKLFKLHGSVNWCKRVTGPFSTVDPHRSEPDVILELIRSAPEIETSTEFRMGAVGRGKLEDIPVWPAIAIPVTTKRKFECPDEHLATLKQLLPETKKIVTIGWRGADYHFLELLMECLEHREVPTLPVAGSDDDVLEVVNNLRSAANHLRVFPSELGFSDSIVARNIEIFCR